MGIISKLRECIQQKGEHINENTLFVRQLLFLLLSPEELLQVVLILDGRRFVLRHLLHPLHDVLDRQIILDLRSTS